MKKIILLCAVLSAFCAFKLVAEEAYEVPSRRQNEGIYFGALGGINWVNEHSDILSRGRFSFKSDQGYTAGGVVGFRNGPLYASSLCSLYSRIELEASYRFNKFSRNYLLNRRAYYRTSSHIHQVACLVNFLVDVDIDFPVTPFIGLGGGYAFSSIKGPRLLDRQSHRFVNLGDRMSSTNYAPALQGIIGLNYALVEKIELSLDYRYLYSHNLAINQSITIGIRRFF